jgi:hypothetical protein
MVMPPEDVSDEDLFRALLKRPAPSEVIDWPGHDRPGWKIRIEVLRKHQVDDCRERAQRWWDAGHGKAQEKQGLLTNEIIADRVAGEILACAVTRPKPIEGTEERGAPQYPKIFPNADGVRQALFEDELHVLWQAYQLTQYKYGPYEDTITTLEERNAWVEKLSRGGNAYPLLRLPLPQLQKLTASLSAERCVLCGVLASLLPELPQPWASAIENLGIGIGSSSTPAVRLTEQGGLTIEWPEEEQPLALPPKDYIDVREMAEDIVREARLEALTTEP